MTIKILLQSDWYIHVISSFLLFLFFYLLEKKYLKREVKVRIIFLQIFLANLIDIDHLLSIPIYQAGRCSINNHLFHNWYFFPFYFLGLFTKYKYFFSSLILHLTIDFLGCL
jgi:hypothetical protein